MSFLQTTSNDIAGFIHLCVGNSVTNQRIEIQKAQRRIVVLQDRAVRLRANEATVKSRYYSTLNQAFIDARMTAGVNSSTDPIQSLEQKGVQHIPNKSLANDRHDLYYNIPGIKEMEAELNRIDYELNEVTRRIKEYSDLIKNYDAEVSRIEDENKKSIAGQAGKFFSAVGDGNSPSPSDEHKDQVAKSKVLNLLLMQSLAMTYLNYTSDPTTKKRKFPDELNLVKSLANIRQHFWAHAQSFPEFLQDTSDGGKKLNFDDPASTENFTQLEKVIKIYRGAVADTKITVDLDKFIQKNVMVTNDASVSKDIGKNPNPIQPANNSLNLMTKHAPSVLLTLGDHYKGSWELPTIGSVLSKVFKKKSATFYPLPVCPNVPKPPQTATERKESRADVKQAAYIDKGTQQFKKALEDAKVFQAKQNQKTAGLLGELPYNAPDWVVQFTQSYQGAEYGTIKFPLSKIPLSATYTPSTIVETTLTAKNPAPSFSLKYTPAEGSSVSIQPAPAVVVPFLGNVTSSHSPSSLLPLTPSTATDTNPNVTPAAITTPKATNNAASQAASSSTFSFAPEDVAKRNEASRAAAQKAKSGTTTVSASNMNASGAVITSGTSNVAAPSPVIIDILLAVTRTVADNLDDALATNQETMDEFAKDFETEAVTTAVLQLDQFAYQTSDDRIIAFTLYR